MSEVPWYADGLRFGCTRCGNCCVGGGTVRVGDGEISALAGRLGMSEHEFRTAYTRELRDGDVSLRELRGGACVFLSSDPSQPGCRVYSDRPRQCRSWPFWRGVVHSRERWEEEAADCPGMNRGARFEAREIEASLAADGTSGRVPPGG